MIRATLAAMILVVVVVGGTALGALRMLTEDNDNE